MVAQFAEILFAQTEQCGAVELGVASDVVVGMGMQVFSVLVEPGFLCVVVGVYVYELRIPVRFLSGNIVTALENQIRFPEGARW